MRNKLVVAACLLAAPISTADAATHVKVPVRCENKPASVLCGIHFYHKRVNVYRGKMHKKPVPYHYLADKHSSSHALRVHILRGWHRKAIHAKNNYHHWQAKQRRIHAYATTNVVLLGQMLAAQRGWTGSEWSALHDLWQHESGWNPNSVNTSSGACGIPQFYPCRDLGDAHAQIVDGLAYIAGRYHTPSGALAHWIDFGWY